jgi:general transcriptional corepressor TUP1
VGHNDEIISMAFTPDGKGLVSTSSDTLRHWNLEPLLRTVQRGTPRQAYEVGVEHAGSVAEKSGENEGLCVCTVEFLGHAVRVLCSLSSLLGLVILYCLRRNCFIYFYFF